MSKSLDKLIALERALASAKAGNATAAQSLAAAEITS